MGGPEVNNFTIDNGSSIDCHSTSGYIITIDGMIVIFRSRKQKSVFRSCTKSELLSASDSLKDYEYNYNLCKFLLSFNKEFGEEIQTTVRTDNENVKQTLSQGFLSTRTRHVAISLNKITETIKGNNIDVQHISGKENPADILTKQIPQNNRKTIMKKINITGYYSKNISNNRGEC
jgi:hypothetical protein